MAWDCIPLEDFKNEVSNIPYITRFENLKSYVDGNGVHLIPADIVYSFDAAMEICQKYYDAGEEGAILKDKNMVWSSKRAKNAIKLKLELDCDLEVIGYQEGTGKLEGLMGALLCQSRDNILKVSVGGGYSFKQRAQIAANYHNKDVSYITIKDGIETVNIAKPTGEAVIGQILATLYNVKIECDGQWSLFLPRALNGDFRLDKSVADSFGEIK
jgi:DNA ligase-1